MEQLTISRAVSDGDLLEIVPLKALDDAECTKQETSDESALEKILNLSESVDFWIAKTNNTAVGYAVGRERNRASYRSEGVYVLPLYRDREIGRALKWAQIKHAKEMGFQNIVTNVARSNKVAIQLLISSGHDLIKNRGGYIAKLLLC
jgi:ribosomal protein S18 acetylase RimI-like enzyme